MDWLGRAHMDYVSAPKPISLSTSQGPRDLLDICREVTPACQLNPLLFNGHVQTCFTTFENDGPALHYKRRLFEQDDPAFPGTFAVDFVVPEAAAVVDPSLPPRTTYFSDAQVEALSSSDSRPMLVALHGLSGGSHEVYLKHVLAPLVSAAGDRKWEACVVISRGCAMHRVTTDFMFNARSTWDLKQTILWLRKMFPNRPLYGVGFSSGGCVLVNYLGEEGDRCPLEAAVILSNPWNFEIAHVALQSTFLGRRLYSTFMGRNVKQLMDLNKEELSKNPRLDFDAARAQITHMYEFDRHFQAPIWGYPSEGAYYRDASCVDSLLAVKIPLFAIHALDDPLANKKTIPWMEFKHNPYTVLCTTSLGGHLAWFEVGGTRWHAKPVTNFLNKMAFETNTKHVASTSSSGMVDEKAIEWRFDAMQRKWSPRCI